MKGCPGFNVSTSFDNVWLAPLNKIIRRDGGVVYH